MASFAEQFEELTKKVSVDPAVAAFIGNLVAEIDTVKNTTTRDWRAWAVDQAVKLLAGADMSRHLTPTAATTATLDVAKMLLAYVNHDAPDKT